MISEVKSFRCPNKQGKTVLKHPNQNKAEKKEFFFSEEWLQTLSKYENSISNLFIFSFIHLFIYM